jgi:mannose-1-phosphate guanylyltransferase
MQQPTTIQGEASGRWPIVLAGGQGRRMAEWIEKHNGVERPKQFCAFTGVRTMLQHTIDRAGLVAPEKNTITVITRGQRPYFDGAIDTCYAGRVMEQPADRGTAAGVLLSAARVLVHDPEATILILPSDHFVHPERRFLRHAEHACRLAGTFEESFVLLGAVPSCPETDYGWILHDERKQPVKADGFEDSARPVSRFREKPSALEAEHLFLAGALWNTMVVAVKVKTLWAAAERLVPDMVERLEFLVHALRAFRDCRADASQEGLVLDCVYREMEPADFSRDILKYVANRALVIAMQDVAWSDWGRPQRVEETLHRALDIPEVRFQATGELP